MSSQIALVIPEEHAFTGMVRERGRTLLTHHTASAQDIDDLTAVVGELCANVSRHARPESGYYRVTLEHGGDTMSSSPWPTRGAASTQARCRPWENYA